MKKVTISSLPNDEKLCRRLSAFGIHSGNKVKIIAKTKSGVIISFGGIKISLCGNFDGLRLTEVQ